MSKIKIGNLQSAPTEIQALCPQEAAKLLGGSAPYDPEPYHLKIESEHFAAAIKITQAGPPQIDPGYPV
jgi:hypothetical protein